MGPRDEIIPWLEQGGVQLGADSAVLSEQSYNQMWIMFNMATGT